jgi:hypothetical protein
MFRAWKCSVIDLACKISRRHVKYRTKVGVLFDESRHAKGAQAGHTVHIV